METGTLIWAIVAVLALAGLYAVANRNQKSFGAKNTVWAFVGLGLAAFLTFGQLGYLATLGFAPLAISGEPGSDGQTPTPQPSNTGVCVQTDPVTVTVSAIDAYTDSASGGTHRYRINGNPALTLADAGTFTGTPGSKVEVLFFNGSTTGAYYSSKKDFVIPCAATTTLSDKLYQNGTVTLQVFNSDDVLINGNAANQTLGAGDTYTLVAKARGQYQRGVPYGGVMVAEYNTTELDDVIVNFGGESVNVPGFFTVSATINKAKAYTVPAILSNAELVGSVYLDADDTINPSDNSDVTLRFYPNNYYVDDKDGSAIKLDSNDENDAQTYGKRDVTIVHLS